MKVNNHSYMPFWVSQMNTTENMTGNGILQHMGEVPICLPECQPGPVCSKQMTSLVNVLLKFQTLISQICQYFLLKKCEKLIFSTKNICLFSYIFIKHLRS